jgi:hypothetical protein
VRPLVAQDGRDRRWAGQVTGAAAQCDSEQPPPEFEQDPPNGPPLDEKPPYFTPPTVPTLLPLKEAVELEVELPPPELELELALLEPLVDALTDTLAEPPPATALPETNELPARAALLASARSSAARRRDLFMGASNRRVSVCIRAYGRKQPAQS